MLRGKYNFSHIREREKFDCKEYNYSHNINYNTIEIINSDDYDVAPIINGSACYFISIRTIIQSKRVSYNENCPIRLRNIYT